MGVRIVFLIVLSIIILATPAFARSEIESHPYFVALVAAEQCEGHRPSIVEELRLAQAMSRDTGTRISSEDVRAALNEQRSHPNRALCQQPQYAEALNLYRTVLNPMLRGPILRERASVG